MPAPTSLREYLIGSIPRRLRVVENLSAQGAVVRSLIVDSALDDHERAAAILRALVDAPVLERDAFLWLKVVLRGHYGGEYAASDLNELEQRAFWGELSNRWPEDAEVRCVFADTALLAGDLDGALTAFNRAFALAPQLMWSVGGEIGEAMYAAGGMHALRYRLASVRAGVQTGRDDLAEDVDELRAEHPDDPEVLAAIEKALRDEVYEPIRR